MVSFLFVPHFSEELHDAAELSIEASSRSKQLLPLFKSSNLIRQVLPELLS
jgi:hypothetical protein